MKHRSKRHALTLRPHLGSTSSFSRRRALLEGLERREMLSSTLPPYVPAAPAAGSVISNTPHVWTADANGLYHTNNLASEWQGDYQAMLAGNTASLTPLQRMEGDAEAVFENTGLNLLDPITQQRDREDAQREFDAIIVAQQEDQISQGIDPTQPLTEHTYIVLGQTLQADSNLYELALQGHGLNDPAAARYDGYTNDFQNNVDNTTLFIGGGLNNNEAAIPNFFDDNVLSHLPFPVVVKNGKIVQLNQNAAEENQIAQAVIALDDTMYNTTRVLIPADFSTSPSSANNHYVSPFKALVTASAINLSAAPSNNIINGLLGPVSTTINSSTSYALHNWTADASGLFHTSTNLQTEWQTYYQLIQTHQDSALTPVQRLEGNAEAVFENTALANVSPSLQQAYREDAQREFDAMAAAMSIDHITGPLTVQTYMQLDRTIEANATLLELAMQGHGLNNPPASRYGGYTNDFQNTADNTTLFVGGGLNNGKNAIADFFDDNILSHILFPVVWRNGYVVQLNQNADQENRIADAVNALDESMFYDVYVANDFGVATG